MTLHLGERVEIVDLKEHGGMRCSILALNVKGDSEKDRRHYALVNRGDDKDLLLVQHRFLRSLGKNPAHG